MSDGKKEEREENVSKDHCRLRCVVGLFILDAANVGENGEAGKAMIRTEGPDNTKLRKTA